MEGKRTLQRRMAIDSGLMDLLKAGADAPASIPMYNNGKFAPNRAARGLKRETAQRTLNIRVIDQIGAPSKRGLLKRAETISIFEWYQSVDQSAATEASTQHISAAVVPEAPKVESAPKEVPKLVDKELEEDESMNVFLDAWNQLDAADENLKQQNEIKNVAVEQAAIEALREQVGNVSISPITSPEVPRKAETPPTPVVELKPLEVSAPTESTPSTPAPATTTTAPTDKASPPVDAATAAPTPVEKPAEPAAPQTEPIPDAPPDRAAAEKENSYTGPHYTSPITQTFVEEFIQYCATAGLNAKLPLEYAQQIVSEVMVVLKSEPTILDVAVPKGGKVIVCGDTHGQFPDLITILRDTGFPSPSQTIIFNGDFVDRGPAGVEVILTLYCLKLLFPKYLYLHRGNHEQDYVNKTYNFEQQVLQKYNESLYSQFQDTFGQLPLGAVIADKIFVIHGGLPEDTSIDLSDIRKLSKLRDIPVGKGKTREEKIIEDLLWSDPRDRRGIRVSKRGAGVEFGPDITSRFMKANSLDLLVRSHELVSEGFQQSHDNQVMTVFSASYYCGSNTNKGAFIIFEDGYDFKEPSVVQFYSQAFSAKDNVLKSCVRQTLDKLRERIWQSRHALLLEFSQRDRDVSGSIPPREWCAAMAHALAIQIEWSGMLAYLAKVEEDGNILYAKFIARYEIKKPSSGDEDADEKEEKIHKRKHKRMVRDICTKFLTIANTFEGVYADIDDNSDGRVDYLEFFAAISSFELGLTNDQICDLMFLWDDKKLGIIDYKQFKAAFYNQFERVKTISGATWISEALHAAGEALSKEFDFLSTHKARLKSGFRKVPKDDDDKVTHELFTKWLVKVLKMDNYSQEDRMKMAMYVDFNNNGKISWHEFKRAFVSIDGNSIAEDILLHMCEVVIKSKTQLSRAFQLVDVEATGKVDVTRFKAGLIGMNVLLDNPLTDNQIKKLHAVLDKEGTGHISYSEFLDLFSVRDPAKMKAIAEGALEKK